jgi:hypothetical protein
MTASTIALDGTDQEYPSTRVEYDRDLKRGAYSNLIVQRRKLLIAIGKVTRVLIQSPLSPGPNRDLKTLTTQLSCIDKILKSFDGEAGCILPKEDERE